MTETAHIKFDYVEFMKKVQQVSAPAFVPFNGNHDSGIAQAVPDIVGIAGTALEVVASIADSLQRIANAQETIAHLTNIDLDETIRQGSKILYAEMKAKEMRGETN